MSERNKSSDTTSATRTAGWDPASLVDANQQALQSWARAIMALTEEMGQFAQSRFQEDMSIWGKLASCKDVGQAFECQRQFIQKATTDYIDEASKLSQLTVSMATDGFSTLQSAARAPAKAAA